MKKLAYILPVIIVLYLLSCSKTDDPLKEEVDSFERSDFTASWVNNLLLPTANDFKSKVTTLNTAVIAFTDAPDEAKLTKLRTDLFEAYKVWQHTELFFYGSGFSLDINSYPTDVNKIVDNINSTVEVNLERTVLNETQGLPAIDYLINGLENTDAEIITKYSDVKYVAYLKRLSARMVSITATAITDFEVSKNDNIESIDNTISSYFSIQLNDFVQYTEKSFREAKIAKPSGTRNRNPKFTVTTSPESVESLYSPENSKALYLEAYDAIQDFYYGRSYVDDANTIGVQEYLQFLGTTIMVNGKDILLDDYIKQLFGDIDTANTKIKNNFFEQTQDFNPDFDAAFDAIQEYVIVMKSNTINAFNLTIDFADNDGD